MLEALGKTGRTAHAGEVNFCFSSYPLAPEQSRGQESSSQQKKYSRGLRNEAILQEEAVGRIRSKQQGTQSCREHQYTLFF